MRIELETVPPGERTTHRINCGICQLPFHIGAAVARAYSDDGVDWREVCPKCLEEGPEGMAWTLGLWVVWHEQAAEEYKAALEEGFEDVPTPEELRLFELLA